MNLTMSAAPSHIPVLLEETAEALDVRPGGRYVDATLGIGGHAQAILERSAPGGQLLGVDADPRAIKMARARLSAYSDSVLLANQNFADLRAVCTKYGFLPVHGIRMISAQESTSGSVTDAAARYAEFSQAYTAIFIVSSIFADPIVTAPF